MKVVQVYFEDDEHKALSEIKGERTWRDFILLLTRARNLTQSICEGALQGDTENE